MWPRAARSWAAELEPSRSPGDAVVVWLRDFMAYPRNYHNVVTLVMAAVGDAESALHTSCLTMRAAGTRLLERAQAEGLARADLDGPDLFALAGALAWLGEQPTLGPRADHLFDVIASAILTSPPGLGTEAERRAAESV